MPWKRWEHGRIWVGKDGRETYYGLVRGRMVSTRRHTEPEALVQLAKLTAGQDAALGFYFSNFIEDYVRDCEKRGITEANRKRNHLKHWDYRLGRPRLEDITLKKLNQAAATMTGARNRIATLKAYYTWLRQAGYVGRNDDPSLDLKKPEPKPRDWDRLVPLKSHKAVLKVIDKRWADLMTVLLGTGMHVSELLRFCRKGRAESSVLFIDHKSGKTHRIQVTPKVFKAAQRSLKAGGFSRIAFYRAIEEACTKAKVPQFDPGGYRHTVATAAVKAGNSPEEVAYFLGHSSAYMVKTIYAKTAVPKKVFTME